MNLAFASLSLAAAVMCGTAGASKVLRGKSGKSPKCGKDRDDSLEARYGTQICPSEIERKFDRMEGFDTRTDGLQNFLRPDLSLPLVDHFSTLGNVALTREQAESVCVTMCQNNPRCTVVTVIPSDSEAVTGKKVYSCNMASANPSLGRGVYLQDRSSLSEGIVTFQKKSRARLPSFEEVQCNIDISLFTPGVACLLGVADLPDTTCDALVAGDFDIYVKPSVDCLREAGGGGPSGLAAVLNCLVCLEEVKLEFVKQACPTSALDNTTIIRDTDVCGTVCYPSLCESEVATAMLCSMGAPPQRVRTNLGNIMLAGGFVNGGPANFTCPSVN